jgi:hypothetical protein
MLSPMRSSIFASRLFRASIRYKPLTRSFHRAPIWNGTPEPALRDDGPEVKSKKGKQSKANKKGAIEKPAANQSKAATAIPKVTKEIPKAAKEVPKAAKAIPKAGKQTPKLEQTPRVSENVKTSRSAKKSNKKDRSAQGMAIHNPTISDEELADTDSYFEKDLLKRYKIPHASHLPDLAVLKKGVVIEWDGNHTDMEVINFKKDPLKYLDALKLTMLFTTKQDENKTFRTKILITRDPHRRHQAVGTAEKWTYWAYQMVHALGDGRTPVSFLSGS